MHRLAKQIDQLNQELFFSFRILYFLIIRIELSEFNKNDENTLPIPAVFVVDENRMVTYKFLDVNYMNRVDIEELIRVL